MPYSQGQYLAYMSLLGGMGAESKRERPYDHPERSLVAAPVAALSPMLVFVLLSSGL